VLWGIATSAVGLLVMLVLATTVFGLSFLSYGVALVPFLLVLFLFGIALGIVACGLVLRFGPAAEWFVWPIPAILSPFAGVFYPLSTLPAWMRGIAYALPPSYVFEGVRAIVSGDSASLPLLTWGVCLAIGYVGVASWLFTRVYRHAVRSGLIARYSAETIS
jgi:ABC-2 type transport system permease protein